MRLSSLGLTLAAGCALVGQTTTGALAGQVKDSSGKPIPGAKVILSSPALFTPRTVLSDANGEWRAPLLPVGNYKVQVFKDEFVGSEAHDVRVGIGTAVRQDLVLKPISKAGMVVEVVAEGAEADKASTKTSMNFSAEVLDTLSGLDRGFEGAADLSAGVAGTSGGGYSVRGGATQNTLYRINGTDIKDDLQGAQVGTWVIEDNIADVQVVLSPLNARNGRALGGQVNVVTKSGGNDFEGSIRAHLSRPTWNSRNPYTKDTPHQISDNLSRTFDVTASGPIVKDRIWFSIGTILTPSATSSNEIGAAYPLARGPMRTGDPQIDAAVANGVPSGYAFASFLTDAKPYTQGYSSNYFEAKVTGALNANHSVDLSYVGSGNKITNVDPGVGVIRVEALGTQEEKRSAWGLNYRGILGEATFLGGRVNRYRSQAIFPTGDPKFSSNPVNLWLDDIAPNDHYWYSVGLPFGMGTTPRPDKRNNTSGNLNLKLFRDLPGGQHEIDFGAEYYQADRTTQSQIGADNRAFRVGGAYYNAASRDWLFPAIIWPYYNQLGQSSSGNTGLAPTMFQYFGQDGITKNTTSSLYANDSLTINNHWGMMVGLRFDAINVIDTTGKTLAKASDLSPRFQLRWDVKGDSHHVFTLTAARFQGDFTSGFTAAFITEATSKEVSYGFSGIPGQPDPYSDPAHAVRWLTYAQLIDPRNYTASNTYLSNYGLGPTTAYGFSDNSKSYILDPHLKSPYLDEATLTYRASFASGNYMRFTYVSRAWKKDWAFSSDYTPSQLVTISDPSHSGLADKLASTVHVFNSDDLIRRYQALEVEIFQRITSALTLNGTYTYGRLTGNSNGGDNPYSTFRDNSIPGYYGNRTFLIQNLGKTNEDIAPTGPLNSDQTHHVRLNFSLERPLDKGRISYSALVRYDSGNNWSAAYAAPLGENAGGPMPNISNAPPAPATYTQYYGGRGQYTYNDQYQVDVKVSFRIPLGFKTLQLIGDLQINNVFNQMEQGTYSTATASLPYGANHLFLNTTSSGTFGGANPKEANYWIAGRSVGASLGMRF
ncbi:TonB-dependent receptor [Geothrix limicola]|nr:carboxypeptidase regulatory-like domain-containing protein [Geothrix limicola]